MLRLPRFSSASGMFADERVPDFGSRLRLRIASLVRRVCVSTNSLVATVGWMTQ